MTTVNRSIRLIANSSTLLDKKTAEVGEIFYDNTNQTIRIMDGSLRGGRSLASQAWVNDNTISQLDINNALIPYVTDTELTETLTSYVTETELATTLISFVTETELATTLISFVTETELATTLISFVTETELATTLISFATDSEIAVKAPIDNPTFTGTTTVQQTVEKFASSLIQSNAVTLDFSSGGIFTLGSNAENITANFTNIPTTAGQTISVTIIISQGSTAYIPNVLTINSASQTIKWLAGVTPTGYANKTDFVSFTFICTATSSYTVTGSLGTYG